MNVSPTRSEEINYSTSNDNTDSEEECTILENQKKEKRKEKRILQRGNRYYKGREIKSRLNKPYPRALSGTYVTDGRVYCFEHSEAVNYWCEFCRTYRCEKCANVMYFETCSNHHLTPLEMHVNKTKALQQEYVQKSSTSCLRSVDLFLKYICRDQEQVELQTLAQKERIRQEFISLHQLLIDEEQRILKLLHESLTNHTTNNKAIEERCGQLIEDEASLMCNTLQSLLVDDLNCCIVEDVTNLIHEDWSRLNRKVRELKGMIQSSPAIVNDRITVRSMKTFIKRQFLGVRQPMQIVPISVTIFLENTLIHSPIKVSDLFSDGDYEQNDITGFLFDIKIYSDRHFLQRLTLRFHDHVCNSPETPYLCSLRRYRIYAKIIATPEKADNLTQRGRNVLIVTGMLRKKYFCENNNDRYVLPIQQAGDILPQFINVHYINGIRQKYKTRCEDMSQLYFTNSTHYFHKWVDFNMWMFSSLGFCKGFFDVSPDEMRALAYCVDRQSYDLIEAQLNHDFQLLIEHASQRHGFIGFDV